MNDKLVAGVVTAAAITPVCALCVLGPAAVGALFVGAFGWIGDIGAFGVALMMVVAAGLVHFIYLRAKKRRQTECGCEDAPAEGLSTEQTPPLPDDRKHTAVG